MRRHLHHLAICTLMLAAACDSVETEPEALVLEAYFQPGHTLPAIRVSRSVPLNSSPGPSPDAQVSAAVDGRLFAYRPAASGGVYLPTDSLVLQPGQGFRVEVSQGERLARASGVVPPPASLDSVRVSVPDEPIAAVLVDSLALGLDSLALPTRTGFIYPVEVTLWWRSPPVSRDNYWIETGIRPAETFSGGLIDFFLLPSSVLEEPAGQGLSWTGVYAVPVPTEGTPLPEHEIRVSLVRGTVEYARFALSRNEPARREPVGNVQGGIGIVTGIAVDTARVYVK